MRLVFPPSADEFCKSSFWNYVFPEIKENRKKLIEGRTKGGKEVWII